MSHASGPLSKESGFFMHTTNPLNLQKRTLVYNQHMKRDMTSAFDVVAEGYTKCRPTWNTKCIEAIVQDCPIRKRALEVGCGSGQATLLLAPFFDQLLATDPSQKLIRLASTLRQKSAFNITGCTKVMLVSVMMLMFIVLQLKHATLILMGMAKST